MKSNLLSVEVNNYNKKQRQEGNQQFLEKQKEYARAYYQRNKEKVNKHNSDYQKEKRKFAFFLKSGFSILEGGSHPRTKKPSYSTIHNTIFLVESKCDDLAIILLHS